MSDPITMTIVQVAPIAASIVNGAPGVGVPAGGTAGQVLAKVDATSYNTQWVSSGGAPLWGAITGTIANQTDLVSALALKANASALATVATSGAYADLSGKPTIPTAVSQLTNDSAFITASALSPYLTTATAASTYATIANLALKAPLASPTFTGTVSGITAAMVGAPSGSGTSTGTNTGDQTSVTGNAGTATTLQTARNINGVSFNGSADITVPAAAGTLTGATLAAGVTSSSLTSLGTLSALNVGGVGTITSTSAAAFNVGANGATNPVLSINASTASVATGVAIAGAATGTATTITATGPGTNEALTIQSKAAGNMTVSAPSGFMAISGGGANFGINSASMSANLSYRGFTGATSFSFTGLAGTNQTSQEILGFDVNLAQNNTRNTGNIATQRDIIFRPGINSFAAASTITDGHGFYILGATGAGTFATITNTRTLTLGSINVAAGGGTVTNSYGLEVNANTGATNNYCTRYVGAAGEIFRVRTDGQIAFLATNTASGTNGAQTINQPSGTVNFAPAATSLVVTNSLCTTNSIVFAVVRTNDSTAVIKNVVPAAGSFTITLNAAATAATSVGFLIIN